MPLCDFGDADAHLLRLRSFKRPTILFRRIGMILIIGGRCGFAGLLNQCHCRLKQIVSIFTNSADLRTCPF